MILLLLNAAAASTLRVGAVEAYATVGEAVTAASSGDTVEVTPGDYAEALAEI